MSLSYTGIEIKTAQSLESWSGGVLVMVSGSVQLKDYNLRRKFMQTFFLAPQEKGFFVLNDIFHFVEEDPLRHHQAVLFAQSNLDPKLNTPSTINKPGKFCFGLCSCTWNEKSSVHLLQLKEKENDKHLFLKDIILSCHCDFVSLHGVTCSFTWKKENCGSDSV